MLSANVSTRFPGRSLMRRWLVSHGPRWFDAPTEMHGSRVAGESILFSKRLGGATSGEGGLGAESGLDA